MTKKHARSKTEQGTTRKVSFADLGATEQDVMVQLAQQRDVNLPGLAAGLWRINPNWKAFDPYPLLAFVLDTLSSRGLVTFRLARYYGERLERPYNIRLSPDGWALMGFPNKVVESGTRDRHQAAPVKTTDGTNYRNHPFHALAMGPIETDTFPQHRALFPHHIHMYGDNQMAAETATERPYVRVTPEMEASVIHARQRLGTASYADIAEYASVPERTVKYILVDLPRLRRVDKGEAKAEGSLKNRIMVVLKELGQIKDVGELRRILGMADDEHSVMHVLHSLHTDGKVDFTERGNGMGTATVINIRLPKRGKRKTDIVSAGIPFDQSVAPTAPAFVQERIPEQVQPLPVISRQQEEQAISARHALVPEATDEETPQSSPSSAPGPESEGYPLLDALLERERNRLDVDAKAMSYIVAAEALADVDPDMAKTLTEKAGALNVEYPSPIEREYIRYVASHPPVLADG